jgi:hypothetical protein
MSSQLIKNNNGHVLAKIETSNNGDQKLYNSNGHYLGEYRVNSNGTFNSNGHQIGYGNLLATLITIN